MNVSSFTKIGDMFWLRLGRLMAAKGMLSPAERCFQNVSPDSSLHAAESAFELSQLYYDNNLNQEAFAVCEEALQRCPYHVKLWSLFRKVQKRLEKAPATTEERYLSLLKKSLLDELYLENEARICALGKYAFLKKSPPVTELINEFLTIQKHSYYREISELRTIGDWFCVMDENESSPSEIPGIRNFVFTSHTMIGRARLNNLHYCMDAIVKDDVPGDFIETGVWKGGATIFMRGFLSIHNILDRQVWVADSFEGLPKPTHEQDQNVDMSKDVWPYLSVGIEEVQELFKRYDLLDEQVQFLKGWFCDTLPVAPIKQLALIRLDGDLYQSTMDALDNLYAKLSPGGFVIVDDYFAFDQCRAAVRDFRKLHGITEEIFLIDTIAVYWRKSGKGTAKLPNTWVFRPPVTTVQK